MGKPREIDRRRTPWSDTTPAWRTSETAVLELIRKFSKINAELGALMAVAVAILLTLMGWIYIPAGYLITAFFLAVLMFLIRKRVKD